MASRPTPLPSSNQRAVQQPAGVMDPAYYQFLAALLRVVSEQATHIEALRVALNEVRAAPGTVFPDIAEF